VGRSSTKGNTNFAKVRFSLRQTGAFCQGRKNSIFTKFVEINAANGRGEAEK
jgi:hypothetical protein